MGACHGVVTFHLVLLMIVAADTRQALLGTSGNADCQCIDPQLMQHNDSTWPTKCSSPSRPLPVRIDGVDYCYPAKYGASTCQRNDMKLEPNCNHPRSAPDWCSRAWCYVDPNACRYQMERSVYTSYSADVFFSYGACGEANAFRHWRISRALRNATLRVHVLDGEAPLWEFYREVFKEAETNYEIVPLRPFNGSAYTACVGDVSIGAVDLCVGSFWETAERRELVNFISPVAGDMFYLVANKVEAGKKINVWSWMDPFTGTLWILIAVTIVVVGLAMFAIERQDAGENHPDFNSTDFIPGLGQSVYLSFSGFLAGEAAHSPSTRAGKLVLIGFGLFLLLTISSYTANLASFLVVTKQDKSAVSGIDELLKNGHKMCIWRSAAGTFRNRYSPRPADSQILEVSNSQDGMETLESGKCVGFLNSDFEIESLLKRREHCDKMRVGLPAMSIWLSQPVKGEWLRPLSFWVVELVSKGVVERINAKYTVADQCAQKREEEAVADQNAGKMDWDDFIGTLAVTYSMVVIALLYRVFGILGECLSSTSKDTSLPEQRDQEASMDASPPEPQEQQPPKASIGASPPEQQERQDQETSMGTASDSSPNQDREETEIIFSQV